MRCSKSLFPWLLCCCSAFSAVAALFDQCNHVLELRAGRKIYINSPYYPLQYPVGTSCRYTIIAPPDYQLNFRCNIQLNVPALTAVSTAETRCRDEIFYFNREGSELLSGSEYFCGSGIIERQSFLNRAVISYISALPSYRRNVLGILSATGTPAAVAAAVTNESTRNATNTRPSADNKFQKYNNTSLNNNKRNTTKPAFTITTSITGLTLFAPPPPPPPSPSTASAPSQVLPTTTTTTTNGLSDALAYVKALLSNSISTSVYVAPKRKRTRRPLSTKRKPAVPTTQRTRTTTAAGTTTQTLPAKNKIDNVTDCTLNIAERLVYHVEKAGNSLETTDREPRIVVNTSPLAGSGGGHFSCLVESVEAQCDCGWGAKPQELNSGMAALSEFASMAGVLTLKYGRIFCGAAIIHHRFLLSAAHCFMPAATNRSELIRVVVGEHDLSTGMESLYTRYYDIDTILLHEHFRISAAIMRNDIALLRTRLSIEWNRAVAPACLPFRSVTGTDGGRKPPIAGQRVHAAGWGTISFGGPQSMLLLKTTLDVISTETCRQSLGLVPGGTFCTYTPGRDTCQYDSGGALYLNVEGRLFAVGIVSYGYACAAQQPSVNTKVASFIPWIKSKTPDVTYCIK